MPWDIVLLAVSASVAGIAARESVGRLAERFGHSRVKAERAVATSGLSLILETKHDSEAHATANS
jgi:hypothetical protein